MYTCGCSLLDVLAGRKDPRGLSGHLLVDGKQQPKNFKCMTGYVVQVGLAGNRNKMVAYDCIRKLIIL